MTHWFLGEILFLQKLKRNIDQDNKVEEREIARAMQGRKKMEGARTTNMI